jgi:integrase
LKSLHSAIQDGKQTIKLEISSTYEKHHLSHLSQFFIWCKNNYKPMLNPCEGISVKYETEVPTFFSVEQTNEFLKLTLDNEHIELLPFHVVCLFAGVRPKECERLAWGDIDFDDNCIVMQKGNAKTKTGRRPEILPVLSTWLKWYQAKHPNAPLIPTNFKRKVNAFRTAFGEWEHNVLRHSFASYYLSGIKKDFGALEATLGNSRLILQKHYVQFPPKADALKFWEITPDKLLKAA